MLDWLTTHADKLPFVSAAAPAGLQVSTQRLFEAAVIGAVLAGLGYVMVIPRLEERVALEVGHIRQDIGRLQVDIDNLRRAREEDLRERDRVRNR